MATKKKTKRKSSAPKKRRSSGTTGGKLSSTVERDARAGGFKRKKPKKPKSKTIRSLENYIAKVALWKKDMNHAATNYRRLQALKKKVSSM